MPDTSGGETIGTLLGGIVGLLVLLGMASLASHLVGPENGMIWVASLLWTLFFAAFFGCAFWLYKNWD